MTEETVYQMLVRRLQPNYVGWEDQYLAVLHALGIHPDTPAADLRALIEMLEDEV